MLCKFFFAYHKPPAATDLIRYIRAQLKLACLLVEILSRILKLAHVYTTDHEFFFSSFKLCHCDNSLWSQYT